MHRRVILISTVAAGLAAAAGSLAGAATKDTPADKAALRASCRAYVSSGARGPSKACVDAIKAGRLNVTTYGPHDVVGR
jgi:hypothetical protein